MMPTMAASGGVAFFTAAFVMDGSATSAKGASRPLYVKCHSGLDVSKLPCSTGGCGCGVRVRVPVPVRVPVCVRVRVRVCGCVCVCV